MEERVVKPWLLFWLEAQYSLLSPLLGFPFFDFFPFFPS
jgi:hypothetical protein